MERMDLGPWGAQYRVARPDWRRARTETGWALTWAVVAALWGALLLTVILPAVAR